MIRGLRGVLPLTYSQTLNWYDTIVCFFELWVSITISSGPFLVSRTGDEG